MGEKRMTNGEQRLGRTKLLPFTLSPLAIYGVGYGTKIWNGIAATALPSISPVSMNTGPNE
jgi:hypothetical protein